jgi:hypothetical protein
MYCLGSQLHQQAFHLLFRTWAAPPLDDHFYHFCTSPYFRCGLCLRILWISIPRDCRNVKQYIRPNCAA